MGSFHFFARQLVKLSGGQRKQKVIRCCDENENTFLFPVSCECEFAIPLVSRYLCVDVTQRVRVFMRQSVFAYIWTLTNQV